MPSADRTGLILDIFASRARSFEGKLQVELRQLRHLAIRLRAVTHLERQKGGIGLRGPGEHRWKPTPLTRRAHQANQPALAKSSASVVRTGRRVAAPTS
ncbi:MAG: hypothetical protein U1F68_13370 [Gammaproteobacteria bacterium]